MCQKRPFFLNRFRRVLEHMWALVDRGCSQNLRLLACSLFLQWSIFPLCLCGFKLFALLELFSQSAGADPEPPPGGRGGQPFPDVDVVLNYQLFSHCFRRVLKHMWALIDKGCSQNHSASSPAFFSFSSSWSFLYVNVGQKRALFSHRFSRVLEQTQNLYLVAYFLFQYS